MERSRKNFLKKVILSLCCLCILGLGVVYGISDYMERHTVGRILSSGEAQKLDADCILVLGCRVHEDGSPSLMLADRLEKGMELYESGASARLLMSGDHGRSEYDEVNTMKAFAVEQGVPSEAVFMDHAGFSTYDSIYRAKDVFQAEKSLWFLRNTTCQGRCISRSVWDWMPMVLRRRIFPIKGQPIEACVKLRQEGRISCWHGCSPSRNFSVRRCRSAAMEI